MVEKWSVDYQCFVLVFEKMSVRFDVRLSFLVM